MVVATGKDDFVAAVWQGLDSTVDMKKNMLFSIVIPCYNYADVVLRAIASVVSQWQDDIEIIVVNDGSTDASLQVVQHYVHEQNVPVRVLDKPNGGASSARNAGIDNSSGRYLVFLDADDELLPDVLAQVRRDIAQCGDSGMLIGGKISADAKGRDVIRLPCPLALSKEARFLQYLFGGQFFLSNGSVFMHREIFFRFRYDETLRQVEDIPLFSWALYWFESRVMEFPVARVHGHADSLRHNLVLAENTGLSLVAAVFDPEKLPAALMKYQARYTVSRCLSLFRTFYKGGKGDLARHYFARAFRASPLRTLFSGYVSKYLRMVLSPR